MENYEKKYKEALRKATKIHRDDADEIKHYMECLFPELAENEDEKIREKLIENFKWFCGDYLNTTKWGKDDILVKDIIIWLEKQGNKYVNIDIESMVSSYEQRLKSQGQGNLENNPLISQQDEYELVAKKVEPKFKVGDWVVFNNKHQSIYQVEKIEDGYYILRHTHGGTFRVCVLHDKSLRLWTTQDAKDGDVLVGKINGDKYIIIFKRIKDVWVETHGHYNGTLNRFCMPSHMFCRDYQGTFTPATQEQRDLLFKRMKEAGYAWDEEKKGIEED